MFAELESLMTPVSLAALPSDCSVIHQVRILPGSATSKCFEKRQARLNGL